MKRLTLLFAALAVWFADSAGAQPIGEIARFENRMPLFSKFRGQISGDFDGDGRTDIGLMQGCTLRIFDGETKTVLWERRIDVEYGMDGDDLLCVEGDPTAGHHIQLLGFLDFSTETHALVTADLGPNGIIAILIGLISKEIAYLDAARVLSVLELPGGRPAVLTYIEQENIFKLVGEPVTGKTTPSGPPPAPATAAHQGAAELSFALKYEAEPGLRLAYDPELRRMPSDTDVDGDGVPDIPMLTLLGGSPSGLVVHRAGSGELLWEYPFPDAHRENLLRAFHGFADTNGDGQKELIAGDNLAITLDGTANTIALQFVTQDVRDVDGDGVDDVIGFRLPDSTVAVYGQLQAGTDVQAVAERIHMTLFQNYPNPFRGHTTIAYQVAEPAQVRLTVYDLLGRRVRTLVDDTLPSGRHQVAWDGRGEGGQPLSAGPYFYRLHVGNAQTTRQAIHLP